jgi:hypothetical protein
MVVLVVDPGDRRQCLRKRSTASSSDEEGNNMIAILTRTTARIKTNTVPSCR